MRTESKVIACSLGWNIKCLLKLQRIVQGRGTFKKKRRSCMFWLPKFQWTLSPFWEYWFFFFSFWLAALFVTFLKVPKVGDAQKAPQSSRVDGEKSLLICLFGEVSGTLLKCFLLLPVLWNDFLEWRMKSFFNNIKLLGLFRFLCIMQRFFKMRDD